MNIDQMAADWDTNLKSKKGNDWNWFFSDTDRDGVMNGIDCKPYNKKRQDGFISLQSQNPFQTAVNKFKAPQGAITSGPNQNVSMAPKPNVAIATSKYSYTDTNKPYTTSSGNVYTPAGVQVAPIFRPANLVTKTGGGLKDYYRANLPAQAANTIRAGYNSNAVETLYDTHPRYAMDNAKSIAAAAAANYLQKQNVKIIDINKSSKVNGQAGYYDGKKNIYMYKESEPDRNGLVIHETSHVMQGRTPMGASIAKDVYSKAVDSSKIQNTEPNISGNNMRPDYITPYVKMPMYDKISNTDKQREAESYYIQQYYNRQQPRNELVDTFERKLDINTARTLTPEQQQAYNNARDTLVKEARDRNDMITGVFRPIKKQSGTFL